MKVYVNEEKIYRKYDELEKRTNMMKISNEYDSMRKNVIERFIYYGREDVAACQYERAVHNIDVLEKLIDKESLKLSEGSHEYKTHRAKIEGFSLLGENKRPEFYVGYGHFATVKKDIENLNGFGVNTIQFEIGPSSILFRKGTHEKWGLDDTEYFSDGKEYFYCDGIFEVRLQSVYRGVIPFLERAEKANVAVSLLISPHYFPSWLYEDYPDLRSKTYGFFNYNIYHPIAKHMLEVYTRALIPLVKDFKCLQSICLSNEPVFDTSADREDNQINYHDLLPTNIDSNSTVNGNLSSWRSFLSDKFKSIDAFNEIFGTDYDRFDNANMPDTDDGSPLFYEWTLWNNKMFSSWHRELARLVKDIAPDIPVCSKFMATFGTSEMPYHRRFLKFGVDPEEFAEFTDFSGNDVWSFRGRSHLPLTYKSEWYDYLASIKKMPINNSEDHVIEDRNEDYAPEQAQRIYADMWQGAVHGRTVTQLWVWERANNRKSDAYGSILHRPDCVEAVGRASLDLNRLAYEVTALQNTKAAVAVLYSKSSRVYDKEFIADMFKAYEAILFSGNRVHFVTEDRINEINEYDLLVLPNVCSTTKPVNDEIEKYINSKKQVLVIDRNGQSLMYDEYKRVTDKRLMENRDNVTVFKADESGESPAPDYTRALTKAVKELVKSDVDLTIDDTYNIEWFLCEHDDEKYINVCNHNEYSVSFSVKQNGEDKKSIDLITETVYNDKIFLHGYQCALLKILDWRQ